MYSLYSLVLRICFGSRPIRLASVRKGCECLRAASAAFEVFRSIRRFERKVSYRTGTSVREPVVSVRERQKRREKLQRKLPRPVHREQDHCSPQHPRNLTQNILEAVEERWRVTYRTVHNLRSKIQEEDMRSTPGYPSESDLDRGCVF